MTHEIKILTFRSLYLIQAHFNEQFPRGINKMKINAMQFFHIIFEKILS